MGVEVEKKNVPRDGGEARAEENRREETSRKVTGTMSRKNTGTMYG